MLQQSEQEESSRVGGGGISADWTHKVTAARCYFAHNTVYASPKGRGGGISALHCGDVAIMNSSFTNNSAVAEVGCCCCASVRLLLLLPLLLLLLLLLVVLDVKQQLHKQQRCC
jgi:hypothetical protein